MNDLASRSARIADAQHLLHLTSRFPALPFPSMSGYMASFRFTAETDAEAAAESVRNAERILSTHLGVTFEANYPRQVGSAAHYQRVARLGSGLYVYITARAEVGPLVDAENTPRELAAVA